MSVRTDLQYFQIPDLSFFDNDKPVKHYFQPEDNIRVDDVVEWEAGSNYSGRAKVVSVESEDYGMICASLVEL